jgi:putative PIN family toxin of toxin-antitoxin system
MRTSRVVLDTNAVLDWLVFRDPHSTGFATAITQGRLAWLASARMRREFEGVLARPELADWQPDLMAAAACWDRHAEIVMHEPPLGPLRCRDPDDQVFIDLALHRRCAWLITRDRALLALRRGALARGLRIATPCALGAMIADPSPIDPSATPPGAG